MQVKCQYESCGKDFDMRQVNYNQAVRAERNVFCSKACASRSRGSKKQLTDEQEAEFIELYPSKTAEQLRRRYKLSSVNVLYGIAARLRTEKKLNATNKNKEGKVIGFCADNKRTKLPTNNHTPVFGHHKMIKDRDKSLEKVAVKIDHKTTVYVTPERARTKYGIAI